MSTTSPTLEVPLLELSDGEHHGVGQLGGQDSVAGAQLKEGDGTDIEKKDNWLWISLESAALVSNRSL